MILHLSENKDIMNMWGELKEKLNQMVFDEKNRIKACGYNEVLRLMCKIEKGEK